MNIFTSHGKAQRNRIVMGDKCAESRILIDLEKSLYFCPSFAKYGISSCKSFLGRPSQTYIWSDRSRSLFFACVTLSTNRRFFLLLVPGLP